MKEQSTLLYKYKKTGTVLDGAELYLETITAEQAQEYLANQRKTNRKRSDVVVDKYVRDIETDSYESVIADPIRFGKNGTLQNGQHRMSAIIRTGRILLWHIYRNMPEDLYPYYDQGKTRKPADILKDSGALKPNPSANIMQLIWKLQQSKVAYSLETGIGSTSAEANALWIEMGEDHICQPYIEIADRAVKNIGSGVKKHALSVMKMVHDREDYDLSNRFWSNVIHGSSPNKHGDDDPSIQLRLHIVKTLSERRESRSKGGSTIDDKELITWIQIAWEAYKKGTKLLARNMTVKSKPTALDLESKGNLKVTRSYLDALQANLNENPLSKEDLSFIHDQGQITKFELE